MDFDINSISKELNRDEKVRFFDLFWENWTKNGFGVLTKKDTELLIFLCLLYTLGDKAPKSNYHWAKLLRLTPGRIKSIRLESHMRFGHLIDTVNAEINFTKYFKELTSIDVSGLVASTNFDAITVSFVVEDPVIQMEIENTLKANGSYLDFHRNKEVIKLKLVDFLKISANGEQSTLIDTWIAEKANESATTGSLVSKVKAKEYKNKSELDKLMTFIDDLADFGGAKPLTEHLKTILHSQKVK